MNLPAGHDVSQHLRQFTKCGQRSGFIGIPQALQRGVLVLVTGAKTILRPGPRIHGHEHQTTGPVSLPYVSRLRQPVAQFPVHPPEGFRPEDDSQLRVRDSTPQPGHDGISPQLSVYARRGDSIFPAEIVMRSRV